ncbi:MAG: hydrogenase iron-sulfur subunit [Candidatus Melainabacteria bacterium]|nr:hydrogenase iron-sulfur subunit [Candidatus Melainabacteria bacterium]
MGEVKTVITLICERAADLSSETGESGHLASQPGVKVVKFPCSGMIQPLMVEAALNSGADGVIVCGCQIGDCYYREGNKMIRDRLLGLRPPGLKKADRRRILALWLARPQKDRFLSEAKDFQDFLAQLGDPAKPAAKAAAKPAEKAEAKPAEKAEAKPAEKAEAKPAEKAEAKPAEKAEAKPAEKAEAKPAADKKPEEKPEAKKSDKKKTEENAESKAEGNGDESSKKDDKKDE